MVTGGTEAAKRFMLILGLALGLSLVTRTVGLADNGPHGGYTNTTEKCAFCHRAHTAQGTSLVKTTATPADMSQLCFTCHAGAGAGTDVRDGMYLGTVPASSLRGGGFDYVLMNPDFTVSQSLPVTSKHTMNGGDNTVWGFGPISPTPDAGTLGVTLTCTNCHNPHGRAGTNGTPTYRILKGGGSVNTPLFLTDTTTLVSWVDVPDEGATKLYSLSVTGDYFNSDEFHALTGSGADSVRLNVIMTLWCGQCHTRDEEGAMGSGSGHTDSGDAIFAFRHALNVRNYTDCYECHGSVHGGALMPPLPGCLTCHVAHGTGAHMDGAAATVSWPGGATDPSGNGRSSLLRLDNRGVCQGCHHK